MSRVLKILMVTIVLWLPGCATAPPKPNPLKTLAIDACADARQSESAFNARKSHQLVRYECEQILALDESYCKIDNKKFRKKARLTYFEEQEYFDEETWFLVTERIRKNYYPTYLSPEEEVVRASLLNEQQNTIEDKSILRQYDPRLLPVSPYLMNYRELGWAGEVVSDLIYENRGNKNLHGNLAVISVIITKERQKKDVFLNRY